MVLSPESITGLNWWESKLGVDHSWIVDLVQVFDISLTIDVWAIREQRPSLELSETQDQDCEVDQHL